MPALIQYKRVLLKVSGEALMGDLQFGHNYQVITKIAEDIKTVLKLGVEICVVVGGGNICRGVKASLLGIERTSADHIGMLATVINALALQNIMEGIGIYTRVLSAVPMTTFCEPYVRRKALRHIEKSRVVIFAAGTGNPFFTTDSAAVLRAIEMNCDLLLKGTLVNGVYNADPKQDPTAIKFNKITYADVIKYNLQVMDLAAVALAQENNLPIKIFCIKEQGNFIKVLNDEGEYTKICN